MNRRVLMRLDDQPSENQDDDISFVGKLKF